jgi:DNA-binding CsgD family transcriptional regulator
MTNKENSLVVIDKKKELTKAEKKVAMCYASGLIGKEVADKLGISYSTQSTHIQHIYEKANIPHNEASLVAWFFRTYFKISTDDLFRQLGAMIFLALFLTTFIEPRSNYARSSRARIERPSRRGGRRDGNLTINYE